MTTNLPLQALQPLPTPIAQSTRISKRTVMCIRYRRVHPSCGHTARGTSGRESRFQWCQASLDSRQSNVYSGPATIPCRPGRGLEEEIEYVSRGYCDNCIIAGITLTKAKGLTDIDAYARSMGVSINDLMRANPGWRP